MATAADTFERKEKKYLITTGQCEAIKAGLAAHMRLDDYGATRIDSLYLDTPDRSLICRSLEKPLYKEKLRIRSYGPFSEAESVFVEIKKKFKGIVYKRRVRMSAEGARAYINGMSYEDAQTQLPIPGTDGSKELLPGKVQIARELDAFFDRYEGLKPSMLISCLREAWCKIDPADEDCVDRITFDEDICYVDLMEEGSVQRRPVTAPDQVIMEIKCAGGYPVWLCELLSSVGAYPRSFSKYGNAYKRVLAEQGAVQVRKTDSGKVSIYRIPTSKERAMNTETLIQPSPGYGLEDMQRAS
ncbi:MAG: polyphosphate polymerase domain-containing protein [Eggerthellaceae bacterium]|nr:polyphosphate polymerase domain-containing protein [Eggerthellaceae bacterium]